MPSPPRAGAASFPSLQGCCPKAQPEAPTHLLPPAKPLLLLLSLLSPFPGRALLLFLLSSTTSWTSLFVRSSSSDQGLYCTYIGQRQQGTWGCVCSCRRPAGVVTQLCNGKDGCDKDPRPDSPPSLRGGVKYPVKQQFRGSRTAIIAQLCQKIPF